MVNTLKTKLGLSINFHLDGFTFTKKLKIGLRYKQECFQLEYNNDEEEWVLLMLLSLWAVRELAIVSWWEVPTTSLVHMRQAIFEVKGFFFLLN
ncbi:hypothetical protein Ccrd_023194 [Cynara cardunculus var. scolymus]|uniref:Uncharacterized protein n=1 Tax=Cynara cardunculus var. scolymus TaxID=59895 RepID=A0A103XXC9_CYNCS|nr:hypothetical protein Ccrd_023194 [Cynara cardunculus var. scolymus]